MEGMNQAMDEEYVWAMRYSGHRESDSELWKERKLPPLSDTQITRRNTSQKNMIPMSDDQNTKVMASLVPDEIIYNVNDYNIRSYDACLLFGDVSGFTDLCEKYNKTGKGGPSRLTQVLNSYIGSMVQEVMSHGGDVLKFSGDAFLAMWKSGPNDSMQDCVHEALDCALTIQKSHGTYETDVGVFLRVKLAISAGAVKFSSIGDEKYSHYVVVGQPIWDVKAAEHLSSAGEIIVSVNAWHYINANEYLYEAMGDGLHQKVHGLGPSWRNTQRSMRYQKQDVRLEITDDHFENSSKSETSMSSGRGEESSTLATDNSEHSNVNNNDDFLLRPAVDEAARRKLKEHLRKYIIPPVMRGIDLDEPLEYLTEMRQIVILFINVVTLKIDIVDFIKLVDKAYKSVCSVVDDMQGCVNKVSLFDKDLMFVIIFGLRGFKHELESQIGLRCASECYQSISAMADVKTCSAAVTTGMTYCGIVGHTLRREYTVISLTVNKAARLMVAYPNKVTCDRETFIHSKMEAKNFILQEHKELKGIVNAGPVYEFKEESPAEAKDTGVNQFPLLGRSRELQLYKKILSECLEVSKNRRTKTALGLEVLNHHNVLLIHGDARQGKTRLLDECIYITPSGIPLNRIALSNRDSKTPFQTIQLLFAKPLGIHESSSSKDREIKILGRLKKLKVPDLLCCLNPVFSVNFDKSAMYLSLNEDHKTAVLEKMIKHLCYACFGKLWVMTIDDSEFIDDESWNLLPIILDVDMICIVMTMGSRKLLSETAEDAIKHKRVRFIKLQSVDKWYHAGLACQIMDVHAIPPELEKLIQSRSNGNPGWIESFLVSLIQAGGLIIRRIERREVSELGLVTPPIDMMVRVPAGALEENEEGHEDPAFHNKLDGFKKDGWAMYEHSFRDSQISVSQSKLCERLGEKETDLVSICTITPNFNIEDVDPELTMDVIMLKTFDSLTSYEQLLLKCSSVLGDIFPRDMLMYIMAAASPRTMALAVQKLFEIRVLGCAKGDFTQGDTCMVFRQRLVNPNQDPSVKCECRGIKIHESCNDLPKYASCGYLRFRLPMFRETTYNLLTDNQKKEFHNRAIRYLEKETRRCRACGNGFFVRILGTRADDGIRRKIKVRKSSAPQSRSQSHDSMDRVYSIEHSGQSSAKTSILTTASVATARFRGTGISLSGSTDSRSSLVKMGIYGGVEMVPSGCFGIQTIYRMRHSMSMTRTFSAADFSNCQCTLILTTMYTQMLEHCIGGGQLEKVLDAMLEYSYVCIISYNIPQAMSILDEALNLLETKPQDEEEEAIWKIPLVQGKITTLIGQCRLELGQLDEAYRAFYTAMQYYGYPFPTSRRVVHIKTFLKELKQNFGLFVFPSILVSTSMEAYEAEFCDNLSECLTLMCHLFMILGMWKDAELAAVWSLNESLKSEMDFYGMCHAYANMMHVMHHAGRQTICIALEAHAIRLCHRKRANVEAQELKAVAKLYGAIFSARFLRSETDSAISIGFTMLRLAATIHAIQLMLQVYPLLLQALLIKRKVTEAVTLLHELEYYAEEDTDITGRTWYFSLCVVLQLETGYTLVPFRLCEKFYQVEGEALITIHDPDAERRYYTVMWLWCIRNEEWEAATVWFAKARDFPVVTGDDTLANIFTALYLLEGLILFLVGKMDKRNVRAIAHAYKEITILVKSLEKATKVIKIILPRFYHLKAYYKFVKNNDSKAFGLLSTAKSYAEKYGNLLELAWIEHSEKAWTNNLSAILGDFWREHCEPDNLMDYHEADFNGGKLGLFTLPLPLYC